MKKLAKGKQTAVRQPSVGKAWWICLIGTLSFCLWGSNALPIQHVEYKLVTNLAVSQHRMRMLQRLTDPKDVLVCGKALPFSSLEIIGDDGRTPSPNADLRSVRVKVRCPMRSAISKVESAIVERTTPSMETDECQSFAKQLHSERWLLESCLHSMTRLQLDQEHDNEAIESDSVIEKESVAGHESGGTASSPFRLTSFPRESGRQTQSLLLENLEHLADVRSENLKSMVQTLDRLKAKSRGFLSMTGSPLIEPIVRPMTGARVFVLFLLVASVWLLLMIWLHPLSGVGLLRRLAGPLKQNSSTSSLARPNPIALVEDFDKTIQWMAREGIPYLGEVQISATEPNNHPSISQTIDPGSPMECEAIGNEDQSSVSVNSLRWLRSLGEGSLVLWIGLLVARFMFDPIWRELVAVAPLAAISRMISGIQ